MSQCECGICGYSGPRNQFATSAVEATLMERDPELVETVPVCAYCIGAVRDATALYVPGCLCGRDVRALAFTVERCDCRGHYRPALGFCLACWEPWVVIRQGVRFCTVPN